jgi:hypothetical protein
MLPTEPSLAEWQLRDVLKVDVEDQSSLGPKLVLEVLIFNN